MRRSLTVLLTYLVTAPIPPLAIGALRVEYENLIFWLAQLYGLPFLPVAELVGDYHVGAAVYWGLAAILIAGLCWSQRRTEA